ncbi:MAG TPA: GyrI-like domain-containing protein [Methylocella sp.]|nr:GyrI-like domain-containing protein [Methylocella sp.]
MRQERRQERMSVRCGWGILLVIGFYLATGPVALAQAGAESKPSPPVPEAPVASPRPGTETAPKSVPPAGVPDDSSAVTLELTARPVAYVSANAEWANGFKSIVGEIAKVTAAIKKAGLTQTGHPFALFLTTDDKSFQFEAMVPIESKPPEKELPGGVKIGDSPAGKAIKFLHRGAYDDIDSTYDLITAFLDEKGLDSENRFIEEYLTDTSEPDDVNLEADIYVFLK